MTRRAVSLTETIVATVILAAVFAGLFASFLSVRKIIARSSRRLSGVNIARSFMGELNKDVNAITWDSANLAIGTATYPTSVLSGVPYNFRKTVSADGANQYRRVNMNINYPGE